MTDRARHSLTELIAEHGPELAEDPRRLEAFLRDYCPECRREISALVSAARQGVPQELLRHGQSAPIGLLIPRLAKGLEDEFGLADDIARWTVESWAVALGLEATPESAVPVAAVATKAGAETPLERPAPSGLDKTLKRPGAAASPEPQPNGVAEPPPRRRRLLVLGLAAAAAFLLALSAGALYAWARSDPADGTAASSTTAASTDAPSTTLAALEATATAQVSTTSTTVAPTTTTAVSTIPTNPPPSTTSTLRTTTTLGPVLLQAAPVKVTTYGGSLNLPDGWKVSQALNVKSDGVSWFEAEGPDGRFLRCVGETRWNQWKPDPESFYDDDRARFSRDHPDVRDLFWGNAYIGTIWGLRWEYAFSQNGRSLAGIASFFPRYPTDPVHPTELAVRFPDDPRAKAEVEQMLSTFRVMPAE